MANFEWYRSFVVIYREGSVTAAARKRHLTQPALTQQLAGLEAEIGEPLFLRTPRRMVPTAAGELLYKQVAQAVDRLERTEGWLKGASRGSVVRLGAPAEYFHEQLLVRLPKDGAGQLLVTFGLTGDLLKGLLDQRLDVVIATQKIAMADIQYVRLGEETFRLVGAPGSRPPFARNDPESAKSGLAAMRWISYQLDLPLIRRFWAEAFGEKPAFSPSLVLPDLRSIKEAVVSGLGISVLPDYLVDRDLGEGRLEELWRPAKPVTNELWLAFRSVDGTDGVIQTWISRLTEKPSAG